MENKNKNTDYHKFVADQKWGIVEITIGINPIHINVLKNSSDASPFSHHRGGGGGGANYEFSKM